MRLTGLALVMALVATGCSDEGSSLYIRPFEAVGGVPLTTLPLTVGQTHTIKLRLSGNVSDTDYVDAKYQQYSEYVEVNPEVLKFNKGEGEDGKDVSFKALKATPVGGIDVVFELRSTSATRKLVVEVADQLIPDAGPLPDQGVVPDTGVTADTGTTSPDGASAADAAGTD